MLPIPSRLHAALASEIFCPQLTPHVCYLVLPHLMAFDFPLTPLLAYLSDVLPAGGLQPSLQLLYSITQLVNPKLGEEQTQFVFFPLAPLPSSLPLPSRPHVPFLPPLTLSSFPRFFVSNLPLTIPMSAGNTVETCSQGPYNIRKG